MSHTRRRFHVKKPTTTASAVSGKNGRERSGITSACALTAIVSCVVAGAPEGDTVAGLKEHVAPVGSPEHAKLTVELKPFCGVTVIVAVP